MKRLVTAVVLMVSVILGGLYSVHTVSDMTSRLSHTLTAAQHSARESDGTAAASLLSEAQQDFEKHERFLSAILNERKLDEVRLGFARADACARLDDQSQLFLELTALCQAVDDLLRSEDTSLENLF